MTAVRELLKAYDPREPRDPLTGEWTDEHVLGVAARLLDLQHPLSVQESSTIETKGSHRSAMAGYYGMQDGRHVIRVRKSLRGIARINAIAHEAAHAKQAEVLGGNHAFKRAYRHFYKIHGEGPEHPMEDQARRASRRILEHVR